MKSTVHHKSVIFVQNVYFEGVKGSKESDEGFHKKIYFRKF